MVRFRQGPDAVEIARQNNNGIHAERVARFYPFEGMT